MDLAMAAGFAGDVQGAAIAASQQYTAHQARQPQNMDVDQEYGELPNVDDLEVAAAAAAAALEVLAPAGSSSDDDSSSDSDDDESSSEDDSSSDDEGEDEQEVKDKDVEMAAPNPHSCGKEAPLVLVQLQEDPHQPGHVQLLLTPASTSKHGKQPAAVAREVETDSSPLTSESSDEESSESEEADEEPLDYDQMRDMITKAYAVADEEEDEDGGGGGGRHNTAKDELGLPELQPLDVDLLATDALEPAGVVLSVLEGVVVVQGLVNSAALAEGSVLVLDEQRVAVGRVEEVFGPVMQPFYVLRWAGKGDAPADLAPGARISVLARTASRITPDTLRRHDRPVDYEPAVEGGEEEEVYFSDDEAEAAFRWKQQAKRKADGADGSVAAGGAAGRGGKQRRRGDGRSNGHAAMPSAALQAHATAGQLSSVLGLSEGHGGRGRGRGRGGGRAGRGRGGAAQEAGSAFQVPASGDRVGSVMQRGGPARSMPGPSTPPGGPQQLMGQQPPVQVQYSGQWMQQGPVRPHAPYGQPPHTSPQYPALHQYPQQPTPPTYPYPGGQPMQGTPLPYPTMQPAMLMALPPQQQPYMQPQPQYTGYGARPPHHQVAPGQYGAAPRPQQQHPGQYQQYPQQQPPY